MSRFIINPFRFEGAVTDSDFCGREKDIGNLLSYMHSGNNVIISMKRRVGKTSLIREIYKNHNDNNLITGYADVYGITSAKEFYHVIKESVKAIVNLSTRLGTAMDEVHIAFGEANMALEIGVNPELAIDFNDNNYAILIKKLLLSLQKYASSNNLKISFAIDEFQKIEKLDSADSDMIQANMRIAMQDCRNISFIILGSNQTALDSIFQENRPLYRQGSHYTLKPIAEDIFHKWVKKKFQTKEITISQEAFALIYKYANTEAKIVQHICFELFNTKEELQNITEADIYKTIVDIYKGNSEISTKFNYLKLSEQKMMKVIALEKTKGVTSSPLLDEYNINHGSVNGLLKQMVKGYSIIKISTGKYEIVDTEMKLWIQVSNGNIRSSMND